MLTLKRNRKGQSTAEYAIVIALAIGGTISMQQYIQRGFQGRMRDATVFLRDEGSDAGARIGRTLQYEPYYVNQSTEINRTSRDLDTATDVKRNEQRVRLSNNFVQRTEYDQDQANTGALGMSNEEKDAGF